MMSEFLLEIGTEELPAGFVEPALNALRDDLRARLEAARLGHGGIATFATPRRLALLVHDLAPASEPTTQRQLGPSVAVAFSPGGEPTLAAQKFAERRGLDVTVLERVETERGAYVAAVIEQPGSTAAEILAHALPAVVHGITFPKSMRWGDVGVTFARPVHWIVALLDGRVIPVTFGDVASGRKTRGHRFLAPGPIVLEQASDYLGALRDAHVVGDVDERRELIREQAEAAAARAGGRLVADRRLLDEVTQLVELPNPVLGTFEERYLDLPREVLVTEMRHHQRYFPVEDATGTLLPCFVAVSNTPVRDEALSRRGYERVLRARLSDGRFFFDEDRKVPLADRVPALERVVFQQELGSYADKVARMRALALWLAEATGRAEHVEVIARAATLAKADLVTGMVGEFPELQGVMGREYALASGESSDVALAIFEHYLPRGADDVLPTQDPGALLGVADRLDSLCGIFAIGKEPTATADPFALRRACLGVIHIVLDRSWRLSVSTAVDEALRLLGRPDAEVAERVLRFVRGRLKALWVQRHPADVVEAVLEAGWDDLVAAERRVVTLATLVGRPDFVAVATAFKRAVNIVRKSAASVPSGDARPDLFEHDAERGLHAAFLAARERVAAWGAQDDFASVLAEMGNLKPAVDRFFEQVRVIADDPELAANRIRLLGQVSDLFGRIADFSKIQTST
ncbi:MAG: glycine--tRNA ligase subunit beta [Egibacteraceae bacterium]